LGNFNWKGGYIEDNSSVCAQERTHPFKQKRVLGVGNPGNWKAWGLSISVTRETISGKFPGRGKPEKERYDLRGRARGFKKGGLTKVGLT